MRCRVLLPIAVALVWIPTATPAPQGVGVVKVTLSVPGTTSNSLVADAGATAKLVAAGRMSRGDRLAIVAQRRGESKFRSVALCASSPCTGRWRETVGGTIAFQAMVTHGSGASLLILGRSRVITITWKASPPPPPPPPPPPSAQPGHYEGKSSQNEKFAFDVTGDGKNVVNLQTGQINTSCPRGTTSAGNLGLPGPYPIQSDGTFSVSINDVVATTSGEAVQRSIAIAGRFSGALASGTLVVQFNWPSLGGICSSGNQTWTIPRTS